MTEDRGSTSSGSHQIWRTLYTDQISAEGVEDLGALNISIRQGDSFDRIPVYAGISCGEPKIRFDDEYVHLNTWQAMMRIHLENARIADGSILKHIVQQGSFESSDVGKIELHTIDEHQRRLELGLDSKVAKAGGSLAGRFGMSMGNSASRSKKTNFEASTKVVREIVLIGHYGKNTIAFGDRDYGDALRINGFLAHEYPRASEGDGEPLFCLEPIDRRLPVRATIYTAVPFDRLHVGMQRRSEELRQQVEDDLERKGWEAVELLRAQMVAAELASRVERNQKSGPLPIREGESPLPMREGEFVVAMERIEIFPESPGGAPA